MTLDKKQGVGAVVDLETVHLGSSVSDHLVKTSGVKVRYAGVCYFSATCGNKLHLVALGCPRIKH